jgi:hypothetical protein
MALGEPYQVYIELSRESKVICGNCSKQMRLTVSNPRDPLLDIYDAICLNPMCSYMGIPYELGPDARLTPRRIPLSKT